MYTLRVEFREERGGAVFSVFLLGVATSIIIAGTFAFAQLTHTHPLSSGFLEESPPEITWREAPRGLGSEPVTFGVSAKDSGAGLDEIVVRLTQNNREPIELARRTFGSSVVNNELIEIEVNPKELGLKEGNAELHVSAFDKSLWNNGAQATTIVEVNYLKPQVTTLTPQQNGVLGGAELVFYRVSGKAPATQGVLAQGSLYPGFQAAGWDTAFKGKDSVYLSLYPIPQSFDESTDRMEIIARDAIGNSVTSRFNYRVKKRRWSSFKTAFTEESAKQIFQRLLEYAQREKVPTKTSGDLPSDLRILLKALALSDAGFIDSALGEPLAQRLWKEAFLTPVQSSPTNSAGDMRTVFVGETEILRGASSGVRFPVSKRTSVVAANGGKVVFIGELGLLGNTVIVDHGFGLSSIYGHLSDVTVQRGSSVERGQQIAATGASGFAQSEEVYFEMRLHGEPVSPNEWWDQSWVTDHIDNKVAFVLRDVR
jgi:murein DD-endopeptidase MepM/ murein hydrolase activator NlpD